MRIVVVGLVAMLAGCADGTDPVQPAEETEPEAPEPTLEVALPEHPDLSLRNLTELYWLNHGFGGPGVMMIQVDVGARNRCDYAREGSGQSTGRGPYRVAMMETSYGTSWSAGSSGELVYAHSGEVDTRTDSDGGGGGRSRSWGSGTFDGLLTFTWAAMDLTSFEVGSATWRAAALSLDCEKPFSIVRALVGREVQFFEPYLADGGTGAGVAGQAELARDVRWSAEMTNATSRIVLAGFGDQAIQGSIQTPDGDQALQVAAESFFVGHEAGRGEYGVTLETYAGARFFAFWGAVYSFGEVLDVRQGMLDASPIPPPDF